MSIRLRWKIYPSGTQSAYLDINPRGGKRFKKFLDVKIYKNDREAKSKRRQAEMIRDKYALAGTNQEHGFLDTSKQKADVLSFLDHYEPIY